MSEPLDLRAIRARYIRTPPPWFPLVCQQDIEALMAEVERLRARPGPGDPCPSCGERITWDEALGYICTDCPWELSAPDA